jgi:hypothetical protein
MVKRVSVLDVIKGRSPNKEAEMAASKKRASVKLGESMAATTAKRRVEDPSTDEPTKMLKEGTRNRSPKITSSGKENQTKGGVYPTYNKGSVESDSFKKAFSTARKAGSKEFTWNGKKYNTKVK